MKEYFKSISAEAKKLKKDDYKENVKHVYNKINVKYGHLGKWNVVIHKSKEGYSLVTANSSYYIYFTRYGW